LRHGRRLALIGLVPLLVLLFGLILFHEMLLPFLVGMAVAGRLLAVPVAALLGVLLRFGLERYRASPLFGPPAPQAGR
jgi:hypothetical protein